MKCKLPNEPLWFDIRACSDIILGGQHKLIVENPFWLVVKTCARMKLDNLKTKGINIAILLSVEYSTEK